MATVAETELEQKTSEYINFVREFFVVTGRTLYHSNDMTVGANEDKTILEYRGK